LLDERVPVFSFIYGIPPREILEECRAKRIVTIGTATTPEEGAALQDAGVDAVVASGFEAGGIAVHSSALRRIHLQAPFRSYLKLPTRSICR
jgi:NAD(P)H-dependent flavin oxidoreductase YrpB (nitropropane dioxygenase family)